MRRVPTSSRQGVKVVIMPQVQFYFWINGKKMVFWLIESLLTYMHFMRSHIDISGGGERKRPKDELPGVSCQPWRRPRPHAWPWCPPTCPARRPIRTKLSGKGDKQKS